VAWTKQAREKAIATRKKNSAHRSIKKIASRQKVPSPEIKTAKKTAIDPIFHIDINSLSDKERDLMLSKVREMIEEKERVINEAKALDPFWWYEPSNGVVTPDGMDVLREYLKEEDIPQGNLDSQLDAMTSTANTIGVSGGNQAGKSLWQTIRRLIIATGEIPVALEGIFPKELIPTTFPNSYRLVTVDHTTFLNTIIPTWQKWTPRDYLVDGSWDKSYREEGKDGQRVLKLGKNGNIKATIEFMTNEMKVQKFQGPVRMGIDYDEEPRQDIYKENLLRFTTAPRLDLTFAFTPTNGLTWATDLFDDEAIIKGKTELYKISAICNPKADMNTLRDILDRVTDYQEIKMRLLGEFISLSGLVYGKLFSNKIHVIDPFVATYDDYLVLLGMDPHLVTPTAAVFMALDREGNKYILDSYFEEADTEIVKKEICSRFTDNNWRWGWSVADKSSNTSIIAFGGKNIYNELRKQPNAIKALRTSEKFEGSIKAGVDEIKRDLKVNDIGKPSLYICNTPSNRPLIQSFKTLERDTYNNEDKQGQKDRIKEGKHHLHAALRYLYQYPLNWYPAEDAIPTPRYEDEAACW
jgi:hypothetical protein